MRFILMSLCLLLAQQQQIILEQEIPDKIGKKQQIVQVPNPQQFKLPINTLPKIVNLRQNQPGVNFGEGKPQIMPSNPLQPPPQVNPQNGDQVAQPIKRVQQNPIKADFYCGGNQNVPLPAYDGVSRQKPVRTMYGFNMYVDSVDTMVSNVIASSGTWEPNYISLIGHIVKPGHKVLNLGSQSGLEALVMGKIVGPTGRLFIFEPYSFSNELVTKNVELNGLQDITTIYKVGASDQKGTAIINIAYMNTGGSEIIPAPENQQGVPTFGEFGKYSESEVVQLDRVDELLPQDVALDFALLDVEKMETKALKGMKKIIERSPNLVIMTEWQFARNPRANKEETLEVLKFLFEQGYTAYAYNPGWQFCNVGSFSPFLDATELLRIDFMDVFFFPKTVSLPK